MCVATTWMLFRVWGPGRVVWGFATGFSLSAIEEDTVPTRHTREPERDSIAHSQVPVWPHVTFKLVRARRAHTHTPDRPEAAGTAGAPAGGRLPALPAAGESRTRTERNSESTGGAAAFKLPGRGQRPRLELPPPQLQVYTQWHHCPYRHFSPGPRQS
jgi:hypothetical protein